MTARTTNGEGDSGEEPPFHLEELLPHKLINTARRMSRVLADRYGDAFELSVTELSVLSAVGRGGALSPTAIAEQTSLDKVRVSRASASLVALGMLRQNRDPSDGRGRLLRLTKRGSGVHGGVAPVARELEVALVAGLGKAELATLTRALGKLNARMDALDQDRVEA
jgi:DNA-binding MarR family transcriptional regulator